MFQGLSHGMDGPYAQCGSNGHAELPRAKSPAYRGFRESIQRAEVWTPEIGILNMVIQFDV